jgi:negative regulator of sigma E activity
MNPITDDDLVLYYYRDGLDADRTAQITAALATSQTLRDRYAAIERAVAQFGQDEIAPDADFSARLWRQLEPQLEKAGVIARPSSARGDANFPLPSVLARVHAWLVPSQLRIAFAAAAVLVVAIGVGFLVGRQSVTVSPPVASVHPDAAAARVLDAYVAANLRATERVLLTASNSDDASLLEGNRELAQSLVESNQLYALAAARAGNTRLADFLRQLEPVLISLANQPGSAAVQSSNDLRHFLDTTDLLFQVRAIEARLNRNGERRAADDGDSPI